MNRRRFLLRATTAVAALDAASATHASTLDDDWIDNRRDRRLPVRMRWPDGDAACALIVYSHGLGGNRSGGDVWGEAWRQAGFAVLHVQHPGSDTEVLRKGMAALRSAASGEQLQARVGDMQFAIDEAERRARRGEPGWQRVRLDALGASGHSFGAGTVQALAGQKFAVAAVGIAEPRFKAFIALSPSPGNDRPLVESFGAVTRPFLAVTGSLDSDALGRGLSAASRAGVYDDLPPGRRALLWLDGADHMSFGGNAEQRLRARFGPLKREPGAIDLEPQHQQRVAAVTTLWWRAHLLGDAAAIAALRAPTGLGAGDRWRQD